LSFAFCSGLENITIPYKVNLISNEAFLHCSNLSKLIILGNIEIQPFAFFHCISLNNITIFGNLTLTSSNIFNNLNKNIYIYYYGSKYVNDISFFNVDNITIYVCSHYLFQFNTFGNHHVFLSKECYELECIISQKVLKKCVDFKLLKTILMLFHLDIIFHNFFLIAN
jgi:hypothetical protein